MKVEMKLRVNQAIPTPTRTEIYKQIRENEGWELDVEQHLSPHDAVRIAAIVPKEESSLERDVACYEHMSVSDSIRLPVDTFIIFLKSNVEIAKQKSLHFVEDQVYRRSNKS